ncbi:MAG: toprim domain-containing protein [Alphaproteobacteria bacterium]|nr:toprim domain-containing protein [Alphaproteobacteria bacterium]
MGDGQPKYLNSPETTLFQKRSVLYGLAQAREAIREAATVIVAEGYMDVIALSQAGFAHAVAPLGTALTEAQMGQLWRLADEPILCFDGDRAGLQAATRAAIRAMPQLAPGRSLRFAVLPQGEDPDSLIAARGPDAFARVLEMARHLVDVVWEIEVGTGKFDTPERRAALRRKVHDRVREITDGEVRQYYWQAFDERLDKLFPARSWGRRSQAPATPHTPHHPPHGDFDSLADAQERALLALMINHPSLVAGAAEAFVDVSLSNRRLDRIRREILNLIGSDPELDTESLKSHLIASGNADLEESVLSESVYSTASFATPSADGKEAAAALHDILNWYRGRQIERDRQDAEKDLAENMTEAKADRLHGILLEQLGED